MSRNETFYHRHHHLVPDLHRIYHPPSQVGIFQLTKAYLRFHGGFDILECRLGMGSRAIALCLEGIPTIHILGKVSMKARSNEWKVAERKR